MSDTENKPVEEVKPDAPAAGEEVRSPSLSANILFRFERATRNCREGGEGVAIFSVLHDRSV